MADLPGAVHLVAEAPELDVEGLGAAVRLAQVAPVAAGRAVDVFEEVAGLIEAARAEVDGEHHLGVDGRRTSRRIRARRPALLSEVCQARSRRVGRWSLRADAVFPVVGRDEVAAGIADHRDIEVLDQLGDVAAHAVLVGGRVAGLVDAGVDGAAEMLEEGPIEPSSIFEIDIVA